MLLTILDLRGEPCTFDIDVPAPGSGDHVREQLAATGHPLLSDHELLFHSVPLSPATLAQQHVQDFSVIVVRSCARPATQTAWDSDDDIAKSDDWTEISDAVSHHAYRTLQSTVDKTTKGLDVIAHTYAQTLRDVKAEVAKRSNDEIERTLAANENLKSQLRGVEGGLQDADFLLQKSLPYRRCAFTAFIYSTCDRITSGVDIPLDQLRTTLKTFLNDPDFNRFDDLPDFSAGREDEREYVRRLNDLKSGIVKLIPRNVDVPVVRALEILKGISPMGAETVRFIESRNLCWTFEARRRMRQLLIHIVGLTFHERILTPFVVGVDDGFSRKLYLLQNYIITRDAPWLELREVRRMLGMASIDNTNHITHLQHKLHFAQSLAEMLSLPSSTPLHALIDSAVEIRHKLTTDLALYSPLWFGADGRLALDSGFMRYEGWNDECMPICVGWGVSETIWLGDAFVKEICIAPAEFVLD